MGRLAVVMTSRVPKSVVVVRHSWDPQRRTKKKPPDDCKIGDEGTLRTEKGRRRERKKRRKKVKDVEGRTKTGTTTYRL